MLEEVKARLESLGAPISSDPSSADTVLLQFAVDKVINHINNQTNLSDIPNGLLNIAIDMATGEFLLTKKSMGQLDVATLDFSGYAKRVQDGDTDVEFAVDAKSTPEAQFNLFIDYLRHSETDFLRYRVLVW